MSCTTNCLKTQPAPWALMHPNQTDQEKHNSVEIRQRRTRNVEGRTIQGARGVHFSRDSKKVFRLKPLLPPLTRNRNLLSLSQPAPHVVRRLRRIGLDHTGLDHQWHNPRPVDTSGTTGPRPRHLVHGVPSISGKVGGRLRLQQFRQHTRPHARNQCEHWSISSHVFVDDEQSR
jgi:hypothetical protein